MKKILFALLLLTLLIPIQPVFAKTDIIPVLSRGHIENLGDYPADHTWVESPDIIGTVGQSKRIEGFELKPDANVSSEIDLRYNVHVQNIGWIYDESDPSTWAKNGDYAGTRGRGLRIEAIKIILLDTTGKPVSGYHVRYRGHVQNTGDLPAASEEWFCDGEQLGTVGSSLRLEALQLEIVKDITENDSLAAYYSLLTQVEGLNESNYSKFSWVNLQTVVSKNTVNEQSSSDEIDTAIATIQKAINQLEDLTQSVIYSKAGSYGPSTGYESISQDVFISAGDVTLQNLQIDGDLIIDEAVGDGNVTLNNVTVSGELRVRGGGKNSIHINGGNYLKILIEQAPDGGVRIVATDLDGVPVVLSENAAGETLILEGSFDSVTVKAPDVVIKTQGQTSIKSFSIEPEAQNTAINLGSTTTVSSLAIASPAMVTGTGTISQAEISADNVSFEKAPDNYTVDPEVVVPPVIPEPTPQPGGGGYTPPGKISLSVTTAPTVSLSKTYDGTTATNVTNQLLDAAAITGIAIGDTVTVTATAAYDNKNVGSNKDITITYSLSGAAASKYTPPVTTTIKGEIVAKPLTRPTTPISKEYDGTTTLNTEITEALGQLATDTLSITRTATYQDIEVGTNKPVTCRYTLSGADADNYSVPPEHPTTGTITKKILTVSCTRLNINKSKIYDGTTDVFNLSGQRIDANNNAISVATGLAAEPTIIVTATAAYNDKSTSINRIITVSYTIESSSANRCYQVTATETISGASITARPLTIAAPTPMAKTYDGTTDVFTATNNTGKIYNTPVTAGNIADTDTGKVTVTATATYDTGKDVGSNKPITIRYTLSGAAAGNYQPLPDDHCKTAAITPLTLNAGAATEKTKEYDGTSTAKLNVALSCCDNSGVFQAEAGKTLFSKINSNYYTDSSCQTETSQIGTGLYLKYTISLEGASAGNYVFSDNKSSLTATTDGGRITAKTLIITPPDIKTSRSYDGTSKVYDPDGGEITSYTVDPSQISGLAAGETLPVTANLTATTKDVGEQTVTISYRLASGNYQIANQTIAVTITPRQLEVDTSKLPAIATTRKYDATTDVYLANNTKLSDYPLSTDAVGGLIDGETITVKATASYDTKDIGENKSITIAYGLSGDAAKNYLAPAADTSKTAAITPRILGYANVNLVTMKKCDDSSSVTVTGADVDPSKNPAYGTDGIVHHAGTVDLEDVSLGSYRADYYDSSNSITSAVGKNYTIKLIGTLTGADAGNYAMTDYVYSQTGQILAADAVISASYSTSNWADADDAGRLTPPAADFKLFYAKQDGSTTFYGYDSSGQIYSSTNLSSWTPVAQVTLDGSKKLIGFDSNSSEPLAIPITPTTDGFGNTSYLLYYWSGGSWSESTYTINNIEPVNPTYYGTVTTDYLIYQDVAKNVIKRGFNESTNETIGSNSFLSLPSGFNNSLLVYNGSTLTLYAY